MVWFGLECLTLLSSLLSRTTLLIKEALWLKLSSWTHKGVVKSAQSLGGGDIWSDKHMETEQGSLTHFQMYEQFSTLQKAVTKT